MAQVKGLVGNGFRRGLEALFPRRWADYQRGAFVRERVEPLGITDPTLAIADHPEPTPGIDLRVEAQLERLTRWAHRPRSWSESVRSDRSINPDGASSSVKNGYFQTPDAEIYGCMLEDHAPRRVVEVGGGFSTLIARRVIDSGSLGTELVVIDPEPRADVRDAADRLLLSRVEVSGLAELDLGDGDLLFIDSSHVLRSGGDLPFLFNQVIPSLGDGALVHVHDIYLPYPYAPEWATRLWTEQFLLQALLCDAPRYRVEFAAHHMGRNHLEQMRAAFGPDVGTDARHFGQSFWFSAGAAAGSAAEERGR